MSEKTEYSTHSNLGNLCAFILACGGEAYSWKRFKIAIYSLSKASKAEHKKFMPIFSYLYGSDCYAGPDDDGLMNDLKWLRDAGYIAESTAELYGASEHSLFELTERGKELGLIAIRHLTKNERCALEDVAELMKNPSNSVAILLHNLAKKWEENQRHKIEPIIKSRASKTNI